MPLRLEPDVDEPVPPGPTGGDDGDDDEPGSPWWHQPWKLAVLGLALIVLGMGVGLVLFAREEPPPGEGSVDVGFLQDMRWHHDQAVLMSLVMLNKPAADQDPLVRGIAADILRSQQFEAGVMAGQLRSWGVPEANESGIGMAWMGMAVPIDRMPGMATDEQLDQLREATGTEADLLFVRLMRAHHEGGLHMAIDALARAESTEVRELAQAIINAQEFELNELKRAEAQLTDA